MQNINVISAATAPEHMEKEELASITAAEEMSKLYHEIRKNNDTRTSQEIQQLNVFLARLLFCFFAEATGIFKKAQFITFINNHTREDGSDLHHCLDQLFQVLHTPTGERMGLYTPTGEWLSATGKQIQFSTIIDKRTWLTTCKLAAFPLLDIPLFNGHYAAPAFTQSSREALLHCGKLDWSIVNPDIFGAMIQLVITPAYRGDLGIHYTSVSNIRKVMAPLFLDELTAEVNEAGNNAEKLHALLARIRKIRIFDPACGSGNFLITAYKALRRLEMDIFRQLGEVSGTPISLHNFYGIEWDDFASEIARLSLWLAAQQMDQEFLKAFGKMDTASSLTAAKNYGQMNENSSLTAAKVFEQRNSTLPLTTADTFEQCNSAFFLTAAGNIISGNATRLDWDTICPVEKGGEVYVLGNPPYIGARTLNETQRQDMSIVFQGTEKGYNELDYIACWFYKGAKYVKDRHAGCAFVSTNSICQGTQVAHLWPHILGEGREIGFVYPSFKWTSNAKANAAVIVIIVGIRNKSDQPKYIFQKNKRSVVTNISPYLIEGDNIFVHGSREQLSHMPAMNFGSMPNDGGHLCLSQKEYEAVAKAYPGALKFIKQLTGSREFINNIHRWCIWIEDEALEEALQFGFIKERLRKVRAHRLQSGRSATKSLAGVPHRFAEIRFKRTNAIIVPATSSQRRHYLPIGFLDDNTVISNAANAIYDAAPWIFAVITSRMHMTWLRAVGGRLKSDYRYSTALCYNTFPFPDISTLQQQQLQNHTNRILELRTQHAEKTLAQLYDPEKMPEALRTAHHRLDLAIEACYRNKPFESDEARLAYLFKAYQQMR